MKPEMRDATGETPSRLTKTAIRTAMKTARIGKSSDQATGVPKIE